MKVIIFFALAAVASASPAYYISAAQQPFFYSGSNIAQAFPQYYTGSKIVSSAVVPQVYSGIVPFAKTYSVAHSAPVAQVSAFPTPIAYSAPVAYSAPAAVGLLPKSVAETPGSKHVVF